MGEFLSFFLLFCFVSIEAAPETRAWMYVVHLGDAPGKERSRESELRRKADQGLPAD